jgi:hypothetical protein
VIPTENHSFVNEQPEGRELIPNTPSEKYGILINESTGDHHFLTNAPSGSHRLIIESGAHNYRYEYRGQTSVAATTHTTELDLTIIRVSDFRPCLSCKTTQRT